MIAIPNMSKPKDCYECPIAKSYLDCLMEKKYVCPIGHTDDCPLIEIVRCGECKWLGVDDGMPFCYWWLREIEPDVFCSYGERRADEIDDRLLADM